VALLAAFIAGTGSAAADAAPGDPKAEAARLLDALRTVPNAEDAALIETHVLQLWSSEGSPAVRLLVQRGQRELQAGANEDADKDFGAALLLDDSLVMAWQGRAEARQALGNTGGAIADLAEAVRRQPHDFAAYRTLAGIAVLQKNWKAALGAWEELLSFDPKTQGADQRLRELKAKALGEET
jgi:tetratricopeptide (TPR) repeat protein